MTGRNFVIGAAIAASLAAIAVAAPKPRAGAAVQKPASPVKQLMQSCDAHKFETVVKTEVNGEPRQSKVKLCGNEGQTDAEWIGTLKDAIAKLTTNKEMAASVREQIIGAISAEITRLESGAAAPAAVASAEPVPLRPRIPAARPLTDEYSSLPPMPTTPPAPPRLIGTTAAPAIGGKRARAIVPLLTPTGPAPKLSFACYTPGDVGGEAPCADFQRDTVVTVRAGEDLRRALELRFARNGEARAAVELNLLRKGKAVRVSMPADVCRGVGDGRLDLQIVDGGLVLASDGPYSLRC